MFPDVSGFVNSVTSHDYNTTILIAMIVLLIMFFKFLIRLIKQILIGGTKKVLIEFLYKCFRIINCFTFEVFIR